MANKMYNNPTSKDLSVLVSRIKKSTWFREDYQHFVGFSYTTEEFYIGGINANDNSRIAISDSRILYKFKTGSRHVYEFESSEKALEFWNTHTSNLHVIEVIHKFKYKRGDIVIIDNLHERFPNQNTECYKNIQFVVRKSFMSTDNDPQEYVFIEILDDNVLLFTEQLSTGNKYPTAAFASKLINVTKINS